MLKVADSANCSYSEGYRRNVFEVPKATERDEPQLACPQAYGRRPGDGSASKSPMRRELLGSAFAALGSKDVPFPEGREKKNRFQLKSVFVHFNL